MPGRRPGSVVIGIWLALFLSAPAGAVSSSPYIVLKPLEHKMITEWVLRSTVAVVPADGRFVCSGTLVSQDQVLTSGHCADLFSEQPSLIQVHLFNVDAQISKTVRAKKVDVNPIWLAHREVLANHNKRIQAFRSQLEALTSQAPKKCWSGLLLLQGTGVDLLAQSEKFLALAPRECKAWAKDFAEALSKNRELISKGTPNLKNAGPGDLALIELESKVQDGFHQPMPIDFDYLPTWGDPRLLVIAGFGFTHFDKTALNVLELSLGFPKFQGMRTIDLMNISGTAVICPGDSGGPTAYIRDQKIFLFGVNAATSGCNYAVDAGDSVSLLQHAEWLRPLIKN